MWGHAFSSWVAAEMENTCHRKPSVKLDGTQRRWKHAEVSESVCFKVLTSYILGMSNSVSIWCGESKSSWGHIKPSNLTCHFIYFLTGPMRICTYMHVWVVIPYFASLRLNSCSLTSSLPVCFGFLLSLKIRRPPTHVYARPADYPDAEASSIFTKGWENKHVTNTS